MDNVPPYANLPPAKVLAAVEGMGFDTDARILALNSYENRVFLVGLQAAPSVVANVYRPASWIHAQK